MTLSGQTSLILNANAVITFALRKLAAVSIGQTPDYNEVAPCVTELNLMLKGWEVNGPHLWRNVFSTVPITTATLSYSLATDNPLRMVEVRYRYPDGHDLPMKRLSRVQYANLPIKSSAGIPTQYYFDPQEASETLYVWPVLQTVTTDQFAYTFQRRFQICTSPNNTIDIPQEWLQTVGYCLAKELLTNYGIMGEVATRIAARADELHRKAKAFDRPAFMQFMPEYRPRY